MDLFYLTNISNTSIEKLMLHVYHHIKIIHIQENIKPKEESLIQGFKYYYSIYQEVQMPQTSVALLAFVIFNGNSFN
jgi:hypothetical protein